MPTCLVGANRTFILTILITSLFPLALAQEVQNAAISRIAPSSPGKIAFTIITILSIYLLGIILGTRIKQFNRKTLPKITFIRMLVLILYFLSVAYVFSAVLLQSGLMLTTERACRGAVYVCLVFYFLSKGVFLLFLTERAHAVRAHQARRYKDWVWITCAVLIVGGFGTILVLSFVWANARISPTDGKCRIGIPRKITIPMLVYDVFVNATLTGIFIWLLRPLMRQSFFRQRVQPPKPQPPQRCSSSFIQDLPKAYTGLATSEPLKPTRPPWTRSPRPQKDWIHKIVYKSMLGAALGLLPTIANVGFIYHMDGFEQGWVCFLFCTVDVTWSVCILHWLTVGPNEEPQSETMASGDSIGIV